MQSLSSGADIKESAGIALVLGGGGPVGRAWEWGLAAGLLVAGIDWRTAGRIVGTSAGALVGAQLGLGQDPTGSRPVADTATALPLAASPAFQKLALLLAKAGRAAQPESVWLEIGQLALTASTLSEDDSLARPSFAQVREQPFPSNLWATAVGTRDARFQVWRASSGVPLHRAVASSAALPGVWPPVTIGEQRYMDGGVRSMLNADLATGCRAVTVVSCFDLSTAGVSAAIRLRNEALNAEIDALRREGATVEVIAPDADFLALTRHGTLMLNARLVPDAFDLGQRLAGREAGRLRPLWSAPSGS